jgi:hypothetical protein
MRFNSVVILYFLSLAGVGAEIPFYAISRTFPAQDLPHQIEFLSKKVTTDLPSFPKKDTILLLSYDAQKAIKRLEENQELFKIRGTELDVIIERVMNHLSYFGRAQEYAKTESFKCIFLEKHKNVVIHVSFVKIGNTKKVTVVFEGSGDLPPLAFVNLFKKILVDELFAKKHWKKGIFTVASLPLAAFLFQRRAEVSSIRRNLAEYGRAKLNDLKAGAEEFVRMVPGYGLTGLTAEQKYQKLCEKFPDAFGYCEESPDASGNCEKSKDSLVKIYDGIYLAKYNGESFDQKFGVLLVIRMMLEKETDDIETAILTSMQTNGFKGCFLLETMEGAFQDCWRVVSLFLSPLELTLSLREQIDRVYGGNKKPSVSKICYGNSIYYKLEWKD